MRHSTPGRSPLRTTKTCLRTAYHPQHRFSPPFRIADDKISGYNGLMPPVPSHKYRKHKSLSRQRRGPLFLLSLLLSGSLLPLSSNDRNGSDDSSLPNYSFRVTLPPMADRNEALSLPELPIYDRDDFYLRVRDSSQDWYDVNILDEEQQATDSVNQTFARELQQQDSPTDSPSSNVRRTRAGRPSRLLDADKRILPDFKPQDILLDESLVPIPPL
ncbi:hypothetical protein P0082_10185 [Candidatus Haliotispira prima]|uniref:Uncharacterized protein n=1 Tax=Candidatus Haliotispira prima TaxID=3034016 RepID=A0ABY8MFU7_9SPIO|nr:hypothetical protein P0082_10185 [Candidatus Haliotispira prima]